VCKRFCCGTRGGGELLHDVVMGALRSRGRSSRNRQDRSLRRLQHGFVRKLGRALEGAGHLLDIGGPCLDGIGPRAEDLGHDHARVAARTDEGAAPDGARDRTRRVCRLLERGGHRLESHHKVRPRI